MGDPTTYHFDLDPAQRPAHAPLEERWWPGIRDAALKASSARIYDPIKGVRAVVIHATAGGSSAGAASVIFDGKASFHWLVPDEDEPQHAQFVWATCHEARAAWHVRNSCCHPVIWDRRGRINHWSLGIEVVNRQVRTDDFSDWQVEATAQIVRYAWAKYPNLRHVVSHAMLDPARRSDPGSLFPWEQFREAVLNVRQDEVPELVAEAAEMKAVRPSAPFCMTV
ncbi:N-acetylmuramoyl-L-alanine amidase [Citromicrobium bathyomarinum]